MLENLTAEYHEYWTTAKYLREERFPALSGDVSNAAGSTEIVAANKFPRFLPTNAKANVSNTTNETLVGAVHIPLGSFYDGLRVQCFLTGTTIVANLAHNCTLKIRTTRTVTPASVSNTYNMIASPDLTTHPVFVKTYLITNSGGVTMLTEVIHNETVVQTGRHTHNFTLTETGIYVEYLVQWNAANPGTIFTVDDVYGMMMG